MRAIVFLGQAPDAETNRLAEQLQASAENLPAIEIAAIITLLTMVCAASATGVVALVTRLLRRRPLAPPANSAGESLAAVGILIVLGDLLAWGLALIAPGDVILRVAASVVALALVVVFLAICRAGSSEGSFPWSGMRRKGLGELALALPLVFLAFLPLEFAVTVVWQVVLRLLDVEVALQPVLAEPLERGGFALAFVFGAAVTAIPVLEEIVFRGGLYRALREAAGAPLGAFLSAAIFAACHWHVGSLVPIFVLALLLAFLYEWTGSLWAPILIHGYFNCINFGLA